MSRLDSEIFFHKAELARVCQGLRAGKHYLVLGPLGIGKSAFLRNIESYWRGTVTTREKAFQSWHVDFSSQPVLSADEAGRFREEVLTASRAYARDEEHVTICVMDHIGKAIIRADVYDLSFFEALAIYMDCPSLRYVIASERSLWDQLREAYPDPERRKRYKLPVLDTVVLGLVPTKEADTFIVKAGGHRHWEAGMPWLVEHTEAIREIAGCYPLFLERAIEELHGMFSEKCAFDAEEFRSKFLRSVSNRYQGIWESLDEGEKTVLFKLSRGLTLSIEERTMLERSLGPRALVTDDHKIFSLAFQEFVGTKQVLPHRGLRLILRPLAWNREYTTYVMLALLLLYVIVVPVIRIVWGSSFWMMVSLIVFVLAFGLLLVLYWRDSE